MVFGLSQVDQFLLIANIFAISFIVIYGLYIRVTGGAPGGMSYDELSRLVSSLSILVAAGITGFILSLGLEELPSLEGATYWLWALLVFSLSILAILAFGYASMLIYLGLRFVFGMKRDNRNGDANGNNNSRPIGRGKSGFGDVINKLFSGADKAVLVVLFSFIVGLSVYGWRGGYGSRYYQAIFAGGSFVALSFYAYRVSHSVRLESESLKNQADSIKAQIGTISFPRIEPCFNQGWQENHSYFTSPGLNFKFVKDRPYYMYISFKIKSEDINHIFNPWMCGSKDNVWYTGVHPGESRADHLNNHNTEQNMDFEDKLERLEHDELYTAKVGILFQSATLDDYFYSYHATFEKYSDEKLESEDIGADIGTYSIQPTEVRPFLRFLKVFPVGQKMPWEGKKDVGEEVWTHYRELVNERQKKRGGSFD